MADRVRVRPTLLEWAVTRAGLGDDEVSRRFPSFSAWVSGDRRPTFRQLEGFAKSVHAPLGYFFLDEPPEEPVPIHDFRTFRDEGVRRPSPDLLDTIHLCQSRQEWYREHALADGSEPVALVGSVTTATPVREVARRLATALRFTVEERGAYASWEIARRGSSTLSKTSACSSWSAGSSGTARTGGSTRRSSAGSPWLTRSHR
jgi:hypothetical protein